MAEPARVLLRTTCGTRIGLGHYRRTLTLAEALAARGASVRMLVAGDAGAADLVRGATVTAELSTDGAEPTRTLAAAAAHGAELVVIDDYSFTADDLRALHDGLALAVIDDLADRDLAADLVVNGAPHATSLAYQTTAKLLGGPAYALLRDAFARLPARHAPEHVGRVLVILGGSDAAALTARVVETVTATLADAAVDVVIGPLAARPALPDRVNVYVAPPELPMIMRRADLAISAAGQTLYELAAVGTPTLAIAVADNQRPQLHALGAAGMVLPTSTETIGERLDVLAHDRAMRQAVIDRGQAMVDGLGAERVAREILDVVTRRRTHG